MGRRFVLLAFVCVLVFMTRWANAQEVTVTGKVTDEAGAPLPGANVFLVGYTYGAATNVGGVYSFLVSGAKMMGQEVVLKASFIGYRSKSRRITLAPGTMEHDFALPVDVLGMEETVVTGVIGETPKEKLAFSVARVGQEQLQLAPATSAVASIQGKVAGAQVVKGSGRPGDPISVRLRGSTSINKSSEPLYIVDGVILGANQVDVDALDLESVEVVKGAAAASPYGARAHTGVVQMKTSRGNNLPLNQTRITVRNEYGLNQLAKKVKVSRHHEFKVNANGDFVDDSGNVVDFADAVLDDDAGYALQDNEFKGPLYDHMDLFFDPGNFYTNSISISQNSQMTNFRAYTV